MPRTTSERSRRIDVLKNHGFRGGRILPHRAMIGLDVSWSLLIDLLVLPLLFSILMIVLLDPLMVVWREFFTVVREPIGLPGTIATRLFEVGPMSVGVPYFTAPADWPSSSALIGGWIAFALLLILSFVMRGAFLPFGYLLRALAFIQITAQLWFTFASPPFTYDLPTYTSGLLVMGVVVLVLAPFLVSATYNIFDFPLWQKLVLCLLLLVHLSVLIPLQVTVHAWIIHNGTLLAMPILYLVFCILMDVFVYVALYSWGMSWRSTGALDPGDRRAPPVAEKYPSSRPRPTPTPQSVRAITPENTPIIRRVGFRPEDR